MFKNYFKIALRSLLKNRLSTLINVAGLSIGISTCIAILIFVKYESTFDAYHSKAEQTYRVVHHNKLPDQTLYWNTTAYPLAEALRNDFPEIDIVTQTAGPVRREFSIEGKQGLLRFEEPNVLFVDPYYLKTFDIEWLAGDADTALKGINSVVLSEELVKKYFGDKHKNYQSILGKTILIQGKDPLTVNGIVKSAPGNSNQRYNMLIPYEFFKAKNPYPTGNWSGNYEGTTFVVLQNEELKGPLESKIAGWKKKYLKPEDDSRISYYLQPLTEIHNETLYGSGPGGYILPSNVLFAAVLVALFILLIAIVNFVNLLTAQSTARSKEVGIRKVLGSKRLDLIRQFIFENSIVILSTVVLSVAIVQILLDQLNASLSMINLQLEFGWNHIGLILLIGSFTILLAAIYPAIVLSAYKPIQALKNKIQTPKTRNFNLRRSLIVFQFIIVQLFVIAAIIIANQMKYFKEESPGFSSKAVVMTPAPEFDKLEVFKNLLLENNSISKVAFGSGPPMAVDGLQLGTSFRLPEQSNQQALEAEMKIGDDGYLDFYDLELLAGRNFTTNKEAFDEFIVNEALLRSYGWKPEDAIGKKIQINEGLATIVGVVKDYHNNSLQREITPCIILNWVYFQNQAFIKIKNENYGSLAFIKDKWEDTFSSSVYRYHFLDNAIEKEYIVERLVFNGFTIFSFLAISIGCLGLFGLMSFVTSRRMKEISIRKVLGASLFQNFSFFTKEFTGLVIVAFIIAVPFVHYFMNLWLEGFTYRIKPTIWMFLSGGTLTLAIAIIICSFQSIKAALTNPIHALREE